MFAAALDRNNETDTERNLQHQTIYKKISVLMGGDGKKAVAYVYF